MKSKKPILLIEDDVVDAMTVKQALEEIRVQNRVEVAEDGVKALEWLKANANRKPCIILLDLNMSRMAGIEFLRAIKQENPFKTIPVVVLTTSRNEQEKVESFKLGIAGYIVKSVDYQQFVRVMRTIDLYWTLCELPG